MVYWYYSNFINTKYTEIDRVLGPDLIVIKLIFVISKNCKYTERTTSNWNTFN